MVFFNPLQNIKSAFILDETAANQTAQFPLRNHFKNTSKRMIINVTSLFDSRLGNSVES